MGVGVCFDVEKEYVGEEDEVLWPHCPEERYGAATTWFQDLKEWTKMDIAGASQFATDREKWLKFVKVTAAQIAPSD